MDLKDLNIDGTWTLFLDRDGVINRRLPGAYVSRIEEWEFLPGVLGSLLKLSTLFERIVVVTNQRGISRGLMTEADLEVVHAHLFAEVGKSGGRIDGIYYCPHNVGDGCDCRKPKPGLAEQAQADFPEIDFSRSLLVGDSASDIRFGTGLGMHTVHINGEFPEMAPPEGAEWQFLSLNQLVTELGL